MARAIDQDPFHCFRFAPRVGFEGKPMGVAVVDVKPGAPWHGPGYVEIEAMLKPDIIEFAKLSGPFPLVVGVFHMTDDFGVDGDPSASIILNNVQPASGTMDLSTLDATSDEIFRVRLRMKYDRLTFVFGRSDELNVLDKIAAVV